MAYFDRFDICEAHQALEWDYHVGGWLHERPSNARRREATSVQLARIQFKPGAGFDGYRSLSDNGKEIYRALEQQWGLRKPRERFTEWGGYPILYVTDEGETLCCECADEADRAEGTEVKAAVHWEGPPEVCAECGEKIESAYGDPEGEGDSDGEGQT